MESHEHFREFVLRRERAKGHGDLAVLARKLIENIFAEHINKQMALEGVLIERANQVATGNEIGSFARADSALLTSRARTSA